MNFSIKMELIALLFTAVLAMFHYEKRSGRTLRYKLFSACLGLSETAILLDIASTLAINHMDTVPIWLNIALCSAYFIAIVLTFSAMSGYSFYLLFEHSASKHCLHIAIGLICTLGFLLLALPIINAWTGWLFSFGEGVYIRGPLNRTGYVALVIELLMLVICFFRNQEVVSRPMRKVMVILPPLILLLAILQQLAPNVMMNGTLSTLANLILFISFQSSRIGQDQLTGLQNRSAFLYELSSALKKNRQYHIVLLHLEHFETVNRKFGVQKGDGLLYMVARYLDHAFTRYRAFRFGNTHFILMGPYISKDIARQNTLQIQKRFASAWQATDVEHVLNVTLSDIICGCDERDENQIMDQLEYALQQAERSDNKFVHFDYCLQEQMRRQFYVLKMIRKALAEETFEVYYQPIYCCDSGEFRWAESLLRLYDEKGRPIPPDEFIPLAEENGLIDAISWLVLKKVCQFWGTHPQIPLQAISINMSMQQIADYHLSERLHTYQKTYGVSPEKLKIEITERIISQDPERTHEVMRRLIEENIQFYLDDFGVGYSNFAGVMALPFETIKLDSSLLKGIEEDDTVFQTIRLLVKMLHSNHYNVVAEGIETPQQAEKMISLKVDRIQGYYYARPMPEKEFVEFLCNYKKSALR